MANFMFGNKSIYYEEYGQGEPLILLNGIMMSCMSWAEFIEPFSTHNRLILVDFLDQGRSARMDDCVEYSQAIRRNLNRIANILQRIRQYFIQSEYLKIAIKHVA